MDVLLCLQNIHHRTSFASETLLAPRPAQLLSGSPLLEAVIRPASSTTSDARTSVAVDLRLARATDSDVLDVRRRTGRSGGDTGLFYIPLYLRGLRGPHGRKRIWTERIPPVTALDPRTSHCLRDWVGGRVSRVVWLAATARDLRIAACLIRLTSEAVRAFSDPALTGLRGSPEDDPRLLFPSLSSPNYHGVWSADTPVLPSALTDSGQRFLGCALGLKALLVQRGLMSTDLRALAACLNMMPRMWRPRIAASNAGDAEKGAYS
ncbi:hypothetical protein DFH09DRAFT_1305033 [Mycena vulgaris]|nr:hypothetical protein DFH09DRAFT_1305033 [Mycena vulgaris]